MLRVNSLSYEFEDKLVFEQLHFQLKPHELLLIKGQNGSGKTTLLRLIAGLLVPTQGEISYQYSGIQTSSQCGQQICFVGHRLGLNSLLSVRENYLFDYWENKPHFERLLQDEQLLELIDTPVGQLSAGQKRRVALLRLNLTKAALWLLDEPFTALDITSAERLAARCKNHIEAGGQIVMSSHQPLPPALKPNLEISL